MIKYRNVSRNRCLLSKSCFQSNLGKGTPLKVKYEKASHRQEGFKASRLPFVLHLGSTSHSAGRNPHTKKSWIQFPTSCYLASLFHLLSRWALLRASCHKAISATSYISCNGNSTQKFGSVCFWPSYSHLNYTEMKAVQRSNASSRELIMPCSTYNF